MNSRSAANLPTAAGSWSITVTDGSKDAAIGKSPKADQGHPPAAKSLQRGVDISKDRPGGRESGTIRIPIEVPWLDGQRPSST